MKTYQISVNGQQYDVEIEDLDASPVQVLVNGKAILAGGELLLDAAPGRPIRVTSR